MAKSIRSKVKRKARAEFRATLGTVAYDKNMAKIQDKLKKCVEEQSLKSLDKLSEQLSTPAAHMEEDVMNVPVEAGGPPTMASPLDVKGENKAPIKKKSSKRKHKLRSAAQKDSERMSTEKIAKEKKRPRFFCQF
eukprot:scaffold1953_cov176-Amphora_coffeaeformis.AAC.37